MGVGIEIEERIEGLGKRIWRWRVRRIRRGRDGENSFSLSFLLLLRTKIAREILMLESPGSRTLDPVSRKYRVRKNLSFTER